MASNKKNVRKCVACLQHDDRENMVRVCKTDEGYVIDYDGHMPGRGAYCHNNPECIKKLMKKRGFNISFKGNVPDSIYEEIEKNDK